MTKLGLRHLLPLTFLALSACAGAAKNDACVPSAEVCNGRDDDCNGQIDDGLGVVTCGQGICEVTVPACANGVPGVCTPGAPEPEICDGLDNDCDGVVDDGCNCVQGATQGCYSGPAGTVGVGPCVAGLQTCTAGEWGPCLGEVKPAAEACDGVDDDCNGQVDDGLPETTCGVGACTVTIASCESGAPTTCTPGTPSAEVCNGIDDDCDGIVDDGVPGVGLACATAKLGVCGAGTSACQGGAVVCLQSVQPSAETCDGLDNDCNGAVDDGNPGGGASCSTGKLGVCGAGTTACQNGAVSCVQNVQPSAEVCDGKDNNCDGQVDEGVKTTYYQDADGDGYGNPSVSIQACSQPAGYVSNGTDCNDFNAAIHPGAVELCNTVDDNCNGVVDEGCV